MHPESFRARFHPSVQAVILAVYACFAIFGLALHHWSGGHRHTGGLWAGLGGIADDCHRTVSASSSASAAEHCCCHGHERPVKPQSDSPQSKSSNAGATIGAVPSVCQGCEQWSSIVQSSSSLASVESVRCDLRIEWTAEGRLSLSGLFEVDWNSRAPPC